MEDLEPAGGGEVGRVGVWAEGLVGVGLCWVDEGKEGREREGERWVRRMEGKRWGEGRRTRSPCFISAWKSQN